MATVTAATVKHRQKSRNHHDPSHDNETFSVQLTSTACNMTSTAKFNTPRYHMAKLQLKTKQALFTETQCIFNELNCS